MTPAEHPHAVPGAPLPAVEAHGAASPAHARLPLAPLAWVMVVALALRLAVTAWLRARGTVFTGYESEAIALQLVGGHGYAYNAFGAPQPSAFQYPVYTLLLAASFAAFGHTFVPIQLLQALCGAASCGALFQLARRFTDAATALCAALLLAVDPLSVYWTSRPQALTLEVLLLLLLLNRFLGALQSHRMAPWAWTGLLLGVCVMSKSLYLVLAAALVGHALLQRVLPVRVLAGRLALMGGCALVVMAPWMVRNAITLEAFVPLTTNGGISLWMAHNPHATGEVFAADGRGMWDHIPPDLLAKLQRANDVEQDRLFRDAANAYIREDLPRALAGIPARLRALWWFERYVPTDFPQARVANHAVVMSLALAGMWLLRRRWRELAVFPLCYAATSAVYAWYFGSARFRYLFEFSFLMFAAVALMAAWRAWGPRRVPG
jgi:hypothetical protein